MKGVLLLVLAVPPAAAAERLELRPQVLRVEGTVKHVLAEDLDGDRDLDLLVFSVVGEERGQRRRRVSWFIQKADGFSVAPDRAWTFDPEGAVLDLGRSSDGRYSLFYSVPEGIRRYRLVPTETSPPRPELYRAAVNLLSGRSDEAFFFYDFVRDWLGKGTETPAVLQPGRLLLLQDAPSLPPFEIRLRTEVELFEFGAPREFRPATPVFVNHSFPALTLADWNADGRPDLLAAVGERVEVHLAADAPPFAREPAFEVRLPVAASEEGPSPRPSVQLQDVNGDGRVDALVSTLAGGFTRLRITTELFRGTAGGKFDSQPSASLESQGAFAQSLLADLDGDGRQEVTVVSVPFGISALLKLLITRRISVKFSTYATFADGRMSDRPVLEFGLPLRLDFSGPGGEFPVFSPAGDFDGDGVRDLVFADGDDQVVIRRLEKNDRQLELGDPVARLRTPAKGQAMAVDLARRGRSDLILYRTVKEGRGEIRIFWNGTAGARSRARSAIKRSPGAGGDSRCASAGAPPGDCAPAR